MKTNLALLFLTVFAGASCVTVNSSDTCRFSADSHLYQYDPEALIFVVGYPSRPKPHTPYLVLWDSSDESDLTVALASLNGRYVLPPELDTYHCKDVEFHAFELDVESEDWSSYWTAAKDRGDFSIRVVFPDLDAPLHSIGFAFVDRSTQKSAVHCGCLAE